MKTQKEYQKVFKSILKEAKNEKALNHTKTNRLLMQKLRDEKARMRG